MQITEGPPYGTFYKNKKHRSCNPLVTEYKDLVIILKSGMTAEQDVVKLKRSKPPPTGVENYQYPQKLRKQLDMSPFKIFCAGITVKLLFLLKAMQKMNAIYHDKDIDILKLGFTLPKPGQHLSTQVSRRRIETFLEKNREDVVGGLSIIFTRKVVVDETFFESLRTCVKQLLGLM